MPITELIWIRWTDVNVLEKLSDNNIFWATNILTPTRLEKTSENTKFRSKRTDFGYILTNFTVFGPIFTNFISFLAILGPKWTYFEKIIVSIYKEKP